jgi:S-adenosylmethionine synthetase
MNIRTRSAIKSRTLSWTPISRPIHILGSPRGIIERLDLARPIYRPTASFGHFGRTGGEAGSFAWERLDLVDALRARLG